jgi:hypothetical protein
MAEGKVFEKQTNDSKADDFLSIISQEFYLFYLFIYFIYFFPDRM